MIKRQRNTEGVVSKIRYTQKKDRLRKHGVRRQNQ